MRRVRERREALPKASTYHYRVGAFKGINAAEGEGAVSLEYASYAYNVRFKEGRLLAGAGISEASVELDYNARRALSDLGIYGAGPALMHHHRRDTPEGIGGDRLFIVSSGGRLYHCGYKTGGFTRSDIQFSSVNAAFADYRMQDENVLLLTSGDGGMYVFRGEAYTTVADAPPMVSVCMHYERLYGIDGRDTVHYSAALDPTDWRVSAAGAGSIRLLDEGGKLLKIFSFRDYIYIFREHAVHRLTAYADPAEYRLTKVYETDRKIAASSVVQAEEGIFFFAGDALYLFDGYTAKRVLTALTPLIADKTTVRAFYYRNKLYLSAALVTRAGEAVGDEPISSTKHNGMLIADLENGETAVFRGADIKVLAPVTAPGVDELFVGFGHFRFPYIGMLDGTGRLYGTPLQKKWVSPRTQIARPELAKTLKRLAVRSRYPLTLRVQADGEEIVREIGGGDKTEEIMCRINGETVSVEMETETDHMEVTAMTLELSLQRRYYATGTFDANPK